MNDNPIHELEGSQSYGEILKMARKSIYPQRWTQTALATMAVREISLYVSDPGPFFQEENAKKLRAIRTGWAYSILQSDHQKAVKMLRSRICAIEVGKSKPRECEVWAFDLAFDRLADGKQTPVAIAPEPRMAVIPNAAKGDLLYALIKEMVDEAVREAIAR